MLSYEEFEKVCSGNGIVKLCADKYCIVENAGQFFDLVRKGDILANAIFEEWIEIGIPGMIFFILAWMSILYCATDKGRKTATLLVTLYGLNMLTDCMFGRFDGIALWATFMILILLQSDTQCHQQASGDAQ